MTDEAAKQEIGGGTLIVVLVAMGIGAVVLVMDIFGSTTLVNVRVEESPVSQVVTVEEEGIVGVWADVSMEHEGISAMAANDELPHVLDFVVSLQRDGGPVMEQRCNPFDSNVFKRKDTYNSIGEAAGRSFDGRVRNCGFRVTPGQYTVSVHAEPVKPDPRVRFSKRNLVLRLN